MRRDHAIEELPETGAEYKIDVALLKDTATLTIDTTGRSLHRRGYRTHVSKAPLKETLAAAMVMLSYWKRDRPLIDPFCGSGTIAIEAAMIGRNLAPGRNREFRGGSVARFPGSPVAVRPRCRRRGKLARDRTADHRQRHRPKDTACRSRECRTGRRGGRHSLSRESDAGNNEQASLRLLDHQSALWPANRWRPRTGSAVPVDPGCAAQASHVVVLLLDRLSKIRRGRRSPGRSPPKTLQRTNRVHLLPIPRTQTGRQQTSRQPFGDGGRI